MMIPTKRMPRLLMGMALLAVGACDDDDRQGTAEPTALQEDLASPEPAAQPTEEAMPVKVVAGERTPIEGATPTLSLKQPKDGAILKPKDANIRIQLKNWDLAPDPGKHVHVIFDNEPYIAIRDVSKPLDMQALAKEHLDAGKLPEGSHLLRTFPSRHDHESVKEGTPFAMAVFHLGKKSDDLQFDKTKPLLTYSRPKGCYKAGERILLDFYLSNVKELSADGYRVKYEVAGANGEITAWKPHYIENLPEGAHTVRLQLLDKDGQPVAGQFNDTTREITVAQQCPSDAAHGKQAQAPTAAPAQAQ